MLPLRRETMMFCYAIIIIAITLMSLRYSILRHYYADDYAKR